MNQTEILRKLYPELTPEEKAFYGKNLKKASFRHPSPRPYLRFRNLNEQEAPPKPAIEIGIRGEF